MQWIAGHPKSFWGSFLIKVVPQASQELVMLRTLTTMQLCDALSVAPVHGMALQVNLTHAAVMSLHVTPLSKLLYAHQDTWRPPADPVASVQRIIEGVNALVQVCVCGCCAATVDHVVKHCLSRVVCCRCRLHKHGRHTTVRIWG